jgi:hypothetical protein
MLTEKEQRNLASDIAAEIERAERRGAAALASGFVRMLKGEFDEWLGGDALDLQEVSGEEFLKAFKALTDAAERRGAAKALLELCVQLTSIAKGQTGAYANSLPEDERKAIAKEADEALRRAEEQEKA